MQSRYVGDIGDYVKLAILRALSPGYKLGIAWWLIQDESHNTDGRHVSYLKKPNEWEKHDPPVFHGLKKIVEGGQRDINELEKLVRKIISDTCFASEKIPLNFKSYAQRPIDRHEWFVRVQFALRECDLVFLDPDNGLEPRTFRAKGKKSIKSVTFEELRQLKQPERTLIVYHHHTRFKGGHHSELVHQAKRIQNHCGFERVDALRATPYSPRVFYLLNADDQLRQRAEDIAKKWIGHIIWCENIPHNSSF